MMKQYCFQNVRKHVKRYFIQNKMFPGDHLHEYHDYTEFLIFSLIYLDGLVLDFEWWQVILRIS